MNGTVYLIGVAQSQKELDRVRDHARQIRYVRRIVSHVRIKEREGWRRLANEAAPQRPARPTSCAASAPARTADSI